MANNGAASSYLIIGVGDDRRTCQSVVDPNLNSQNVQTLIRDAIHPRPVIRVHRLCWQNAIKPFKGIQFVVIQVGPNGRHAFRLAKDYVSWKDKVHFRKNEVWVRNEDTSDLATPEQIVNLAAKTPRTALGTDSHIENIDYLKLAKANQLSTLACHAKEVFKDLGFQTKSLFKENDSKHIITAPAFRVIFKVRRKSFVMRCCFAESMTTKGAQSVAVSSNWQMEHGLWTFLLGNFTKAATFSQVTVNAKEPWGVFNLLQPSIIGWVRLNGSLPAQFAPVQISLLTQQRVTDKRRLRESICALLEGLESDDTLFAHLDGARRTLNSEINRWMKKSPSAVAATWPSYKYEEGRIFKRTLVSISTFLRAQKSN